MKQFRSRLLQMSAIFILAGNVIYAQNSELTSGTFHPINFTPGISQPAKINILGPTWNEPLAKITNSSYYLMNHVDRAYGRSLPVFEPQTAEDIDKLVPQDTYALPWATIWESDILWKKKTWRTIDVYETKNNAFSNNADIPSNQRLASILIQGFFSGKYKAYSTDNDRFTTALTQQEVISLLTNKQGAQAGSENSGFNPDQVTKFRIKEDWLYLDTERIWVVRILGIAPVREVTASDGTVTDQPLFWLYYPYIRDYLSQHPVYGSQKDVKDYNWDRLFEGRNFSGKIDKVSSDPYRKTTTQAPSNTPREITR